MIRTIFTGAHSSGARDRAAPEDVVSYSRLSKQALYHMPKDNLVHKLVQLEERAGGEGCDYQIRALRPSSSTIF